METLAVGGAILIVVLALAIPLVAILLPAIIIIGVVKAASGGAKQKRGKQAVAQETQIMQEIHHGLSKMTERVEALETILLDEEKKGR